MKQLLFLLLLPFAGSAQTDYSTLGLVKDRIDSVAKHKADSVFGILQGQINAAIAAIPTASNPKGLATISAISDKANAADLSSKVNISDTPQIRTRSVGAAVSMIVQNFLKDYTRTDSMAGVLATINSTISNKLVGGDTAKLRSDLNAALSLAGSKLSAADTVKLRQAIDANAAALLNRLVSSDTNYLRRDITANKALIVARDSIMTLLARIDSVKTRTLFTQTALQTVSATVNKSPMVGSGVGSLTIPANTLTVGKTYRMRIEGLYSTPILLNIATVTCRMELNGTAITTGAVTSLLASANNSAFSAEQLITIRSIGTNGTLVAIGGLNFASATGRAYIDWNTGTGTALINTTIPNTFTPTIQFSNNNSGNSVSSVICTFEALN